MNFLLGIIAFSFNLHLDPSSSGIKPRVWQERLIQLLRRRLSSCSLSSADLLIYAAPGAGKTIGALLGFKKMKSEGFLSHFIVFCHRNSIVSQWKNAAKMNGLSVEELHLNGKEFELNVNSIDGWIVTYQAARSNLDQILSQIYKCDSKCFLAIADEVHHLGVDADESTGPAWGKAFLSITKAMRLRIGLTGTPFRADNLAFCSAKKSRIEEKGKVIEQIFPDFCIEPRDLIRAGDVRPLEFHFQDGFVEHRRKGDSNKEASFLSKELRESWRARNLRRAICLSGERSIALHVLIRAMRQLNKVRCSHSKAAGLVIAKDIEHAIAITNFLQEQGCAVDLVHSQDSTATERLARFQHSDAKWLVSVDMCSEGFDASRLRVVAYLTTVVTRSRFLQAVTRTVRVSKERSLLEPIPRNSSYVFAPADPLLMQYARSWSVSQPYLIRSIDSESLLEPNRFESFVPALPMESINDQAVQMIRIAVAELPHFLKR